LSPAQLLELWNYYKVGIVNTIFGLSLYAFLIFIGMNLFVAQLIGQCVGVVFNYYTFRTHVFKGGVSSIGRFVLAYLLNYALGLGCLFVLHKFIASAYIAGFGAAVVVSGINYFVLKFLVFNRRSVENDA
jgi:putative flippase GtrA